VFLKNGKCFKCPADVMIQTDKMDAPGQGTPIAQVNMERFSVTLSLSYYFNQNSIEKA
jgi:hypothetical protein